jgi:hypothetical protein
MKRPDVARLKELAQSFFVAAGLHASEQIPGDCSDAYRRFFLDAFVMPYPPCILAACARKYEKISSQQNHDGMRVV